MATLDPSASGCLGSPPEGAATEHEGTPTTGRGRHQCYQCSRTYERADHLHRHQKSHENERSYRCHECGKGFNRADLLNRHKAAHIKNAEDILRKRTGRACQACIKAKTKCDESRPCKRCRERDAPCEESEGRRQSVAKTKQRKVSSWVAPPGDVDEPIAAVAELAPHQDLMSLMDQQLPVNGAHIDHPGPMSMLPQTTPTAESRHFEDASLLLGLNSVGSAGMVPYESMLQDMPPVDLTGTGTAFPDFFEHVMLMPGMEMAQPAAMLPPDVSNFTSDMTFDDCDFDFSFLASGLTRPSTPHGPMTGDSMPRSEQSDHSMSRSEAFQKNPFSFYDWIPERNHTSFSGLETIDVPQDRVNAGDQLTSPDSVPMAHCDLRNTERDRMIRLATHIGKEQLAMPSFPSLELLEDLIDIFLLQDSTSIDSYVHAASFVPEHCISELLLAIVAAAAQYIALQPVWKMGMVLQEVVRLAIGELLSRDNATTRELQPLQTFLVNLHVGAWSGSRRKTEIAVSFLQPSITMLSWANAFRKYPYTDVIPLVDDADAVLEEKWHAWAGREGKKRLILHTFLHDSRVAIVGMMNPLLSPAQLKMPLPACRDLWLAPNAHTWRHTYLRLGPPSQDDTPSMTDFFGQTSIIDQYDGVFDKSLCLLVSCHGLGHEVWQYRTQARLLAHWQNQSRRDRMLDHQRVQRDIEEDLASLQVQCEQHTNPLPEVMLTLELLMMSLHVDHDDIQTFSGKLGEEEARKVFPKVLAWSQSTESRLAIWHAGQVFRVARDFEKTRLRDFYAVALYHAALTLWVYGLIMSNAARKSGRQTPGDVSGMSSIEHGTTASSQSISVDSDDEKMARAFKLLGHGMPGVRDLDGTFVPLSSSGKLMSTAEALLKANFPQSRNGLPPLVANLANLLSELGRLS